MCKLANEGWATVSDVARLREKRYLKTDSFFLTAKEETKDYIKAMTQLWYHIRNIAFCLLSGHLAFDPIPSIFLLVAKPYSLQTTSILRRVSRLTASCCWAKSDEQKRSMEAANFLVAPLIKMTCFKTSYVS